jgi:hypothetical protein
MPATDEREKRAQSRQQRRGDSARSSQRPKKAQPKKAQQSGDSASESNAGRGTAALVLAGAGVGALAGTLRSLRKRRARQGDDDSQGNEPVSSQADEAAGEQDAAEDDDGDGKRSSSSNGETGSLRSMAISVLEAAVESLKDVSSGEHSQKDVSSGKRSASDDTDEGPSAEEDDEDEEADREPRGEQIEERPPAPRGEQDPDGGPSESDDEEAGRNGSAHNGNHEPPSVELVRRAREQLAELIGRTPESVSHVEHHDDVWQLGLEVVELERIPHSTDLLASYAVTLDEDGRLLEYARARRYVRSASDDAGLA